MKTLFLLFAFVGAAAAQTFSFSASDTVMFASPTVADDILSGTLVNTSSNAINLLAIRRVNVADTTWSTAICMANCMASTIDTAGAYSVPPGATQLFLLHYSPTATPSSGRVKMEFRDLADTTHTISQWFSLTTGSTSKFLFPQINQSIYFNEPDTISWSTPVTGTAQLSLSTDAGETWNIVDSNIALANGSYIWTPSASFVANAKLKLHTSIGSIMSDLVKVTARFFNPLAGIKIYNQHPDTIRWTPGVSGSAEFDYSVNNGAWVKVTSAVSMPNGQYIWTPSASINSANVHVRLKTASWIFESDQFSVTPASAVHEITPSASNIIVTPNPANTTVTFQSSVPDVRQIQIVDVLGKIVAENYLTNQLTNLAFDVSRLPAGLYSARILKNGIMNAVPFMILH